MASEFFSFFMFHFQVLYIHLSLFPVIKWGYGVYSSQSGIALVINSMLFVGCRRVV